MRDAAPAKVNLCLLIGPLRDDGRHELLSVMQAISLADELEMHDAERDEVVCPGVEGPNLAAAAVAAFRGETGWDGPGQRIEIRKRIPVAAGMGGGSSDAAAALRLLSRRSGLGDRRLLLELAAGLGSDVPALLEPGRVLVRGAGERVDALADPAPFGVLVLPSHARLSTAAVYARADELGPLRSGAELDTLDPLALTGVNDLQEAARALEPSIDLALARVRDEGAQHALVCGSGPTVIGLFERSAGAELASERLRAAGVEALAAVPLRTTGGSRSAD